MTENEFSPYLIIFSNVKLPLWAEFPDLELYMDQLVSLGNRYLADFLETPLTPSMVNSYVKKGVMSRPVKKKYQAKQLAELLLISLLKSIYPLETIKNYIELLDPLEDSYDSFVQCFNKTLTDLACESFLAPSLAQTTQQVIVNAVIFKALGENMISQQKNS